MCAGRAKMMYAETLEVRWGAARAETLLREGNIGVEVMFSRVETDGMIVDTGCNELLSSKKILGKQL